MFVYRVDIPIQALNLYFNGVACLRFNSRRVVDVLHVVTHPVVSQVNPHVHLFFFAPRGSAGKPVAHRKGKGTPLMALLDHHNQCRNQVGGAIFCYLLLNSGSNWS